jgi:hypothetical protein
METQASKPQISVAVRHCEILVLGVLALAFGEATAVGDVARWSLLVGPTF